jgi:hypothetical protein
MKRTNAPGNLDGLYRDDNEGLGIQGTLLIAEDRNAIQEELVGLIESTGLTPSGSDNTQVAQAIAIIAAGQTSIVGTVAVNSIAALRAFGVPTEDTRVIVAGYSAAGDGGGGPLRYWDAASTEADNGGSIIKPTSLSPEDAGRWKWALEKTIPIEAWGIFPGVSADQTASIAAAFAATPEGSTLVFSGVHLVSNLSTAKPFIMHQSAWFKRWLTGEPGTGFSVPIVDVTAGMSLDRIQVDGNERGGIGVQISGPGVIIGSVVVKDLQAHDVVSLANQGLRITGNDCHISQATVKDCSNEGHDNESQPNSVIVFAATGVKIDDLLCAGGASHLFLQSNPELFIGTYTSIGNTDNTAYGSGRLRVGTVFDYGDQEGFVLGGSIIIGEYFLGGSTEIDLRGEPTLFQIGTLHSVPKRNGTVRTGAPLVCGSIAGSPTPPQAVVGRIIIGKIIGKYRGDLFLDLVSAQSIEYLEIGEVNLECEYLSQGTGRNNQWSNLTKVSQFSIGRVNFRLIGNSFPSYDSVYLFMATTALRKSRLGMVRVDVINTSGVLQTSPRLRVTGALNGLVDFDNNYDATPSPMLGGEAYGKILMGNAEPTTGTWEKGTLIINTSYVSSSSIFGWFCVETGSPGTWSQLRVSGGADQGSMVKPDFAFALPATFADVGVSWEAVNSDLGTQVRTLITTGETNILGTVTTAGSALIVRSANSGTSWSSATLAVAGAGEASDITEAIYLGNRTILISGVTTTGVRFIARSLNQGDSWTILHRSDTSWPAGTTTPAYPRGYGYAGSGVLFCAFGGTIGGANLTGVGIYRSTNRGETWTKIKGFDSGAGGIAHRVCYTPLAVSANQVIFSTSIGDGGADSQAASIKRLTYNTITEVWDEETLYSGSSIYEAVLNLVAGENIYYASLGTGASDGRLLYSADFGTTWRQVSLPDTDINYLMSILPVGGGLVFAGSGTGTGDGNLYRSRLYGMAGTWEKIEISEDYETIQAITYLGKGILLLGTGNGTNDADIFRSIT